MGLPAYPFAVPLIPLLLAAAAAASAQDFSVPNALGAIREEAASMPDIRGRAVVSGAPFQAYRDTFAEALKDGLWGAGKADELDEAARRVQARQIVPINAGFQALGARGTKGRIKGPHPLGFADGTYEVVENSPFLVVIAMRTGYIDGRFTLKRDQATGRDTLGFAGRLMQDGRWGAPQNGMNEGSVFYDAATDTGAIRWVMNGQWRQDTFLRGRAGGRSMRITLGGHAHDFFQD